MKYKTFESQVDAILELIILLYYQLWFYCLDLTISSEVKTDAGNNWVKKHCSEVVNWLAKNKSNILEVIETNIEVAWIKIDLQMMYLENFQ